MSRSVTLGVTRVTQRHRRSLCGKSDGQVHRLHFRPGDALAVGPRDIMREKKMDYLVMQNDEGHGC